MVPDGMQMVFQGKAQSMREIAQVLGAGGVRVVTGAAPGGG
jgi:hypothetical protein